MGLDMFVYRISKPNLPNKVFTQEELLNYCVITPEEKENPLYAHILKYTVPAQVINEYFDFEKIGKTFGLKAPSVGMMSGKEVGFYDSKSKEYNLIQIPISEVEEKFVIKEEESCLVFATEDVAYWRKKYDLQDLFYESIGQVENCGYYPLYGEQIRSINKAITSHGWGDLIPEEEPTEDSALCYHEWY